MRACTFTIYDLPLILANSAGPDEMPHFAASHLGLRCMYMMFPLECIQPVQHVHTLNFRLATPLNVALMNLHDPRIRLNQNYR